MLFFVDEINVIACRLEGNRSNSVEEIVRSPAKMCCKK